MDVQIKRTCAQLLRLLLLVQNFLTCSFLLKSSVRLPFGGERTAISICEKKKRWRLLLSQTWVILLATMLLFRSSYPSGALLLQGGIVGEENEETAFIAVFCFLRAASPQEILKAFHGTLTIGLISSTYLSAAITPRGNARDVNLCYLHRYTKINQGCAY